MLILLPFLAIIQWIGGLFLNGTTFGIPPGAGIL
jgi:hypothetical protein